MIENPRLILPRLSLFCATVPVLFALSLASCAAPADVAGSRAGARDAGAEAAEASHAGAMASDQQFARELWTAMAGYREWRNASAVYAGRDPHGAFLRTYVSWVHVGDDAHPVVVKDNFTGADKAAVTADQDGSLASVTVMAQRSDGYGPDHDGWFFVKYTPQGEVARTGDGALIAGQFASCVDCHGHAGGDDYLFLNDGS